VEDGGREARRRYATRTAGCDLPWAEAQGYHHQIGYANGGWDPAANRA